MANNFTLKTAKIEDGEINFTVHGLSLNAIVQLLIVNRDAVEQLFTQFTGRNPDEIGDSEIKAAAMSVAESAPALLAHIIALGADADLATDYEPILRLPIGVQIEALEKIGELTFSAGGGPKKMLALALKMVPTKGQSASQQ